MLNISVTKRSEIILHFNKMHLQDPNIPMWVIKVKGETYYVDHVDMAEGVGFSTKETPDNTHTKGSIKIRAKLLIILENNQMMCKIYP